MDSWPPLSVTVTTLWDGVGTPAASTLKVDDSEEPPLKPPASGSVVVLVTKALDVETAAEPLTKTVTTLWVGVTITLVTEPDAAPWPPCSPVAPLDPVATGTEVVRAVSEPLMVRVTTIGVKDADSLPESEPPEPPSCPTGELLVTETSVETVVGTPSTVVVNTVGTAVVTAAPPATGTESVASPVGTGKKTDALPSA